MTELVELTKSELLVLEWLSKADSSALGECGGRDLDTLVTLGYAEIGPAPEGMVDAYRRVRLTPAGWRRWREQGGRSGTNREVAGW